MRKLKYFAIAVLILMLLPIKLTYAANYCTVEMRPSNTQIGAGDTVTIDVLINDLADSNKITTLTAALNYDTEVFEEVKKSSIKIDDDSDEAGRTVQYVNKGIIITSNTCPVTTSGTVMFSIVMKVKADPVFTGDTTKIELTNGQVSNGSETQSFNASVSLSNSTPVTPPSAEPSTAPSVAPSTAPSEDPSHEPSEIPSGLQSTLPSTKPSTRPTNTIDDGSYKGDKLPQTGITTGIAVIASIGFAGSGFAFFKYYQYKKIIK